MTVVGVGIDSTDVAEVRRALRRHGDRYLRFVLTDRELAECRHEPDLATATARRWAAKEAVTKVLAPTDDDPWPWTHVEVLGLGTGTTAVHLHGRPRALADSRGVRHLQVEQIRTTRADSVTYAAVGSGLTTPGPVTSPDTRG
ncbi:holo-ACP synthase [Arsenicicoccus dermatophilus]|uniref:holo-ACP synthase n=1 Tax=Arsenicicoccus dermatophilus TaxID=1076331 RepID=UPI003916E4C3